MRKALAAIKRRLANDHSDNFQLSVQGQLQHDILSAHADLLDDDVLDFLSQWDRAEAP
jgi:hypothetical protein